jgi:transcriptional regulator with XRE-family HTH domain
MTQSFATKLSFMMKALGISRGRLASDLRIDKSAVGRWVTGAGTPSSHSLAALTALLAKYIEGFTALDWERSCESLGEMIGLQPPANAASRAVRIAEVLPMSLIDEALGTTARRGAAYEGFYRSTRPLASEPGRFVHDHVMIRRDASGFLRLDMTAGGVTVNCVLLPLGHQLFAIAKEQTSGAMGFAILNGVNATKAAVLDGIILNCALDVGRTPTATAVVMERIGDLDGDPATDDARFAALAVPEPPSAVTAIPVRMREHLIRDIGPEAFAAGGDWVLQMPIARSISRGVIAAPALSVAASAAEGAVAVAHE